MARKSPRSMGEMISTVCFAGMALKLALDASLWDGGLIGLLGLWGSSAACAAAAVRFPLQTFADKLRNR